MILIMTCILGTGFGNAMIIWAAGIYNVSSFTDTLEKEELTNEQTFQESLGWPSTSIDE